MEAEGIQLSSDQILSVFGTGGALSEHHRSFEERPQQTAMAEHVWEALRQGHHLIVEAGTGIGKSLA